MRLLIAILLPVLMSGLPASGQCYDRDGDGALAGPECPTASDCDDGAWSRRPGVTELCNGIDDNCDGLLDEGCPQSCDAPFVVSHVEKLQMGSFTWYQSIELEPTSAGVMLVGGVQPRSSVGQLYGQLRDRRLAPWAEPARLGSDAIADPSEIRPRVVTGDDRVLVTYQDLHNGTQDTARLMARVLDRTGKPVSDTLLDLSATVPFPTITDGAPWHFQGAAWDGERFSVFWTAWGYRNKLLMALVAPDGTLVEPKSRVIFDQVLGQAMDLQDIVAVWTGQKYVVVFSVDSGGTGSEQLLRSATVSREGVLENQTAFPVTGTAGLAVTQTADRIALAWSHPTPEALRLFAGFVDLEGNWLPDPGATLLYEVPNRHSDTPSIAWTGGAMTGIAFSTYDGAVFRRTWHLYRILDDGALLDPDGILVSEDLNIGALHDLVWTGEEFWVAGPHESRELYVYHVICDCIDDDIDGFDGCTFADCDDGDPDANPLAPELCRGTRDENCDLVVDCADLSSCPPGALPDDIQDLAWDDTGLRWSAPALAERYDLARGLLNEALRRGDFAVGECAGLEFASTSWIDDGRAPPAGGALWYLVRPEGSACSYGAWGVGATERATQVCR